MEEIYSIIRLKRNTIPGFDEISYDIIKYFPLKMITKIKDFFQQYFKRRPFS